MERETERERKRERKREREGRGGKMNAGWAQICSRVRLAYFEPLT